MNIYRPTVDSKEVDAVTDGFKRQTPPKSKSLLPSLLKEWRQPERGPSAAPPSNTGTQLASSLGHHPILYPDLEFEAMQIQLIIARFF